MKKIIYLLVLLISGVSLQGMNNELTDIENIKTMQEISHQSNTIIGVMSSLSNLAEQIATCIIPETNRAAYQPHVQQENLYKYIRSAHEQIKNISKEFSIRKKNTDDLDDYWVKNAEIILKNQHEDLQALQEKTKQFIITVIQDAPHQNELKQADIAAIQKNFSEDFCSPNSKNIIHIKQDCIDRLLALWNNYKRTEYHFPILNPPVVIPHAIFDNNLTLHN